MIRELRRGLRRGRGRRRRSGRSSSPATGGRSAPAPTSTEIPDDGRVIYDEPYLSTYAQWEAPQEGTPPFRTMTKPILTAVNGLCCGAGLDLVTTGDIVDRVGPGRVLRPAREHRPGVGPRDGAARPGAADSTSRCASRSPAATSGMSAQRAYELGLVSEVVEHDRLLERAREIAAHRQPQRAARGARHPPRDPQGPRPPAARGRDPGRGVPRARRAHRRRQGGPAAFVEKRDAELDGADERDLRDDPLRDVARPRRDDHAEPARGAQRVRPPDVRGDARRPGAGSRTTPTVNAVVLRAAGDRAFCAGLDTKKPYGQPDDVWNHEDPGELLSPKWQKVWKPVVCAVQGICTAGAFYFVNEADIVICSTDATFFDSHVTYGMVSALEPVGLMRRIGLGETLRIALSGNDERVTAETALRIGLVTEVVERDELWDRAHEIAAGIARKPTRRDAGHGARDLGVARPARTAPRWSRACIYTRLGNPIGMAEVAEHAARRGPSRGSVDARRATRARRAHRRGPRARSRGAGARVRAALAHVGRARRDRSTRSPRTSPAPGTRVGVLLRNRPAPVGLLLGVLRAGGCVVDDQPRAGRRAHPRATSRRSTSPCVAGEPDDLGRLVGAPSSRATTLAADDLGEPLDVTAGAAAPARPPTRPGVAVQMLTSGTTGPPKRVDLTYDTLERVLVGAKHYESQPRRRRCGCAPASRSSTRRWCTSAACSASCSASTTAARSALLERFTRRRLGRRRPPPPPGDGEPRARRAAHGARGRPRSRPTCAASARSSRAPRRSSPDDADAFIDEVRRPGAHLLRRHRVRRRRRRAGTSPTTEQFWATKRGSVGRAHAGLRAARRRRRRRRSRSAPTTRACSR